MQLTLQVGVDEAFGKVIIVLTFKIKAPLSSHVLYRCFAAKKNDTDCGNPYLGHLKVSTH